MIREIKDNKNIDEIVDFAWELSKNDSTASYDRKDSKEVIRRDIENAIKRENINLITLYHNEKLNGVCIYNWKSGEKYSQSSLFVIRENYEESADEILNYINNHLNGYEFFAGFPAENLCANKYFKNNGFECIESSIATNMMVPIVNSNHMSNDMVEEIGMDDFDKYADFHDKYATDMYYNSTNIKKDINIFKIYVYKENGEIHGSIFLKCFDDLSDVFGMFIDDEFKGKGIENILVNHMISKLNKIYSLPTEVLYFIDEIEKYELQVALDAGFKVKDIYRCYKKLLV